MMSELSKTVSTIAITHPEPNMAHFEDVSDFADKIMQKKSDFLKKKADFDKIKWHINPLFSAINTYYLGPQLAIIPMVITSSFLFISVSLSPP